MKPTVLASIAALALSSAAGCQSDPTELGAKIDALTIKVDTLQKNVDGLGTKMQQVAASVGRPMPQPRPPRPQPEASKSYAVPIDGDPFEGPADAKVTIVKAYDYLCPFCERVRPTMEEIRKKYGNDVRVVYKQFVVHPQAQLAHLAACAAFKQGNDQFLALDKLLWDKGYAAHEYTEQSVADMAKDAGLDVAKLQADMKGQDCQTWLQKDRTELDAFGVGSTPSFFVNGRYLVGAMPSDAFAQVVDEELRKANERIAAGTPQAAYYETWIVEKGEKKLAALTAPAIRAP
jgi:protein-disulfide isomerase